MNYSQAFDVTFHSRQGQNNRIKATKTFSKIETQGLRGVGKIFT